MPKFKSILKHGVLTVRVKPVSGEKINDRELEYISGKQIRGLLHVQQVRKLFFKGVEYTGPAGISLNTYLEKTYSKREFLFLLEQIVDLVQKLKINSIPYEKLLWDIRHIYIHSTTGELFFMYLPFETIPNQNSINGFLENLVDRMILSEEDKEFATTFIFYLRGMGGFDPERIEKFVLQQAPSIVRTIKAQYSGENSLISGRSPDYYANYCADDELTGLLCDDEATELLEEDGGQAAGNGGDDALAKVGNPSLLHVKTQTMISVDKAVFRLGKEGGSADYRIPGNTAVSRNHAEIITRGGRFYVKDLGSKNGTSLNGKRINALEEFVIADGDQLLLADEEYVFTER